MLYVVTFFYIWSSLKIHMTFVYLMEIPCRPFLRRTTSYTKIQSILILVDVKVSYSLLKDCGSDFLFQLWRVKSLEVVPLFPITKKKQETSKTEQQQPFLDPLGNGGQRVNCSLEIWRDSSCRNHSYGGEERQTVFSPLHDSDLQLGPCKLCWQKTEEQENNKQVDGHVHATDTATPREEPPRGLVRSRA